MPRKGARAAWQRIAIGQAGDEAAANSEAAKPRRARRRRIRERGAGRMEENWIAALREGRRRRFRGEKGWQGARCRKSQGGRQEHWRGKGWRRRWEDGGRARSSPGFLRQRWERRAR